MLWAADGLHGGYGNRCAILMPTCPHLPNDSQRINQPKLLRRLLEQFLTMRNDERIESEPPRNFGKHTGFAATSRQHHQRLPPFGTAVIGREDPFHTGDLIGAQSDGWNRCQYGTCLIKNGRCPY